MDDTSILMEIEQAALEIQAALAAAQRVEPPADPSDAAANAVYLRTIDGLRVARASARRAFDKQRVRGSGREVIVPTMPSGRNARQAGPAAARASTATSSAPLGADVGKYPKPASILEAVQRKLHPPASKKPATVPAPLVPTARIPPQRTSDAARGPVPKKMIPVYARKAGDAVQPPAPAASPHVRHRSSVAAPAPVPAPIHVHINIPRDDVRRAVAPVSAPAAPTPRTLMMPIVMQRKPIAPATPQPPHFSRIAVPIYVNRTTPTAAPAPPPVPVDDGRLEVQAMLREMMAMLAGQRVAPALPPAAPSPPSSDAVIAEVLALACMRAEMQNGSRDSTALRKLVDDMYVRMEGIGGVLSRVESAAHAQVAATQIVRSEVEDTRSAVAAAAAASEAAASQLAANLEVHDARVHAAMQEVMTTQRDTTDVLVAAVGDVPQQVQRCVEDVAARAAAATRDIINQDVAPPLNMLAEELHALRDALARMAPDAHAEALLSRIRIMMSEAHAPIASSVATVSDDVRELLARSSALQGRVDDVQRDVAAQWTIAAAPSAASVASSDSSSAFSSSFEPLEEGDESAGQVLPVVADAVRIEADPNSERLLVLAGAPHGSVAPHMHALAQTIHAGDARGGRGVAGTPEDESSSELEARLGSQGGDTLSPVSPLASPDMGTGRSGEDDVRDADDAINTSVGEVLLPPHAMVGDSVTLMPIMRLALHASSTLAA